MPRLVPADNPNGDFVIPDAARISYQKGTRKLSTDAGLIDHLIRNHHSSPVEQAELKYSLRMPLFCVAQLVRHRTSSLNQESARYSVIEDDFYVPEPQHWAINTAKDKQATKQVKVDQRVADVLHKLISDHNELSYKLYKGLLEGGSQTSEIPFGWETIDIPGIAREQARMVLCQNIFSRLVWKQDLKNHLHFLMLRTDHHAQFEIREYADAMARVVEKLFPATWASFKDNVIDGVSFSKTEWSVIHAYIKDTAVGALRIADLGWTARRVGEFLDKCEKAGFNFKESN
jgi:thymidylate synthase (FAD)